MEVVGEIFPLGRRSLWRESF